MAKSYEIRDANRFAKNVIAYVRKAEHQLAEIPSNISTNEALVRMCEPKVRFFDSIVLLLETEATL